MMMLRNLIEDVQQEEREGIALFCEELARQFETNYECLSIPETIKMLAETIRKGEY